jgi:hypothetical protein
MVEAARQALFDLVTMTLESAIIIVLAALTAFLAALAVAIGIFAIFGYTTLRDGVRETAKKHVEIEMDLKMKAYPSPAQLIELSTRMEALLGNWDQLQNQGVTDVPIASAAEAVASASDPKVKQVAPDVAPPYPKEQ